VGNIRTGLYSWAYARHTDGTFVFRIEDTDRTRVTDEYIHAAIESMRWLGLDWDEGPEVGGPYGPYLQSERMDRYREWTTKFLAEGHAYHCYCTPEELEERREAARAAGLPPGYDGRCRTLTAQERGAFEAAGRMPTVRFQMPEGTTGFTDLIRGEDLLSSTPRQLAVYRAMGVAEDDLPRFAHLPFVMGQDNAKLSKRHGAITIGWYRQHGFLPEAMCNYLALLGWSPGEDREFFSLPEMARDFTLERVNRNAARFDMKKLEAMNGDWIRALDPADFAARITPVLQTAGLVAHPPTDSEQQIIEGGAPLIQERTVRLTDAIDMLGFLLVDEAHFSVEPEAAARLLTPESRPALEAAVSALYDVDRWVAANIERALRTALVDKLGLKPKVAFSPVRVAVSGRRVSPPLFESLELLGRKRTLARLNAALDRIPFG
jgi:glutamyl-tRNA synthetase